MTNLDSMLIYGGILICLIAIFAVVHLLQRLSSEVLELAKLIQKHINETEKP